MTWISILYIPATIVVSITLSEKSATHLASVGRLTFILVMLWIAYFLRRLLDRQTGVMSSIIRGHPENFVARMHRLWTFLFVAFPVALIVLASAGYTLTGMSLIKQFRFTIETIGIGVVAYAMIIRWFSMRERKLVLEQRIRERQERAEAEAREAEGIGSDSMDESSLPDFDEDSIDFEAVGDQTRRLLRFVVGAAVAIAIWFGWADILPALRGLDGIKVVGDISLGALIPAVFILIVTTIGAKNLPGLLEIGVLSHHPPRSGASLYHYLPLPVCGRRRRPSPSRSASWESTGRASAGSSPRSAWAWASASRKSWPISSAASSSSSSAPSGWAMS